LMNTGLENLLVLEDWSPLSQ